jgi:hypothetical protein
MKSQEEIVTQIMELAAELGWSVAFDQNSETLHGLIIGEESYVLDMVEHLGIEFEEDTTIIPKDQLN